MVRSRYAGVCRLGGVWRMASILMHPSRLPQLSCVYITLIFPSPTQSLSPSLPTGTPPTHWHLLPFTGIHSGCRLSDVVWPIASGMKSSRKSPVQQAFLPLCFPCDRVPLAFVSPPPRAHSRRTPPSRDRRPRDRGAVISAPEGDAGSVAAPCTTRL